MRESMTFLGVFRFSYAAHRFPMQRRRVELDLFGPALVMIAGLAIGFCSKGFEDGRETSRAV
jgi:hypothetical protein